MASNEHGRGISDESSVDHPVPEYHLDPDAVDGPPPWIDIECCPGVWVPYPAAGQLSECPRCHSVFVLAPGSTRQGPLYLEPGLIIGPESPWRQP
jgi:hypothetical protein